MVKLLLELGASIDEKSKVAKQTPLGLAAELGESEVRQRKSEKLSSFSFFFQRLQSISWEKEQTRMARMGTTRS